MKVIETPSLSHYRQSFMHTRYVNKNYRWMRGGFVAFLFYRCIVCLHVTNSNFLVFVHILLHMTINHVPETRSPQAGM